MSKENLCQKKKRLYCSTLAVTNSICPLCRQPSQHPLPGRLKLELRPHRDGDGDAVRPRLGVGVSDGQLDGKWSLKDFIGV